MTTTTDAMWVKVVRPLSDGCPAIGIIFLSFDEIGKLILIILNRNGIKEAKGEEMTKSLVQHPYLAGE